MQDERDISEKNQAIEQARDERICIKTKVVDMKKTSPPIELQPGCFVFIFTDGKFAGEFDSDSHETIKYQDLKRRKLFAGNKPLTASIYQIRWTPTTIRLRDETFNASNGQELRGSIFIRYSMRVIKDRNFSGIRAFIHRYGNPDEKLQLGNPLIKVTSVTNNYYGNIVREPVGIEFKPLIKNLLNAQEPEITEEMLSAFTEALKTSGLCNDEYLAVKEVIVDFDSDSSEYINKKWKLSHAIRMKNAELQAELSMEQIKSQAEIDTARAKNEAALNNLRLQVEFQEEVRKLTDLKN